MALRKANPKLKPPDMDSQVAKWFQAWKNNALTNQESWLRIYDHAIDDLMLVFILSDGSIFS